MKYILSFFTIFLFISGCKQHTDYYPPPSEKISESMQSEFTNKLKLAYLQDDLFGTAFQLANLDAPSVYVFDKLREAVHKNPEKCTKIYSYYRSAYRDGFFMKIVRSDTLEFRKIFKLCLDLKGQNSYNEYHEQMSIQESNYQKQSQNQDSTNFNLQLRQDLRVIFRDDQFYRRKLADFRTKKEMKDSLTIAQNILDSINLLKIDSILQTVGYPSSNEVGRDLQSTIWMVLHHQNDKKIRNKYLPILKANISESQLKVYEKRTKSLQ